MAFLTQKEIAQKIGCSTATVCNIVKKNQIPKTKKKIDFEKYEAFFLRPKIRLEILHAKEDTVLLNKRLIKARIANKLLEKEKRELQIKEIKKKTS